MTDKNFRFVDYLKSENEIIKILSEIDGVAKTYGIHQIPNPLNEKRPEIHMVLENCQYGSMH